VDPLVAILAGGRGERVGGGKPSLRLGGRPMLDYPVSAARHTGAEVVVVAKPDTALPPARARVLREPAEPRHPLCGIVAALCEANGPIVAVGCDLPFLTSELLAWLAGLPDPLVVPEVDGRLQPLLARYDPAHLDALERALEERAPLQETVRALGPRLVGASDLRAFGDPGRLLFNINTRDDLAEADRLLAAS
jgi:molybdenum cofactor guanylyltransferase